MADSHHSKQTGNAAVHPATYVTASDPASPDTSVTADNKLWIDTTTGTTFATGWLLKIRASSNTVWTTILDLATSLALKANLASPTFTGTPAAPTAAPGTSTTQLATTAFVTTADNLKANLASPTFTGTPAAPTATGGTNTTQLATTAFVAAAIAALINSAPGALDTLEEIADALGDDANFAATMTTLLALKAPLASPALTGTPSAPTASPSTNTTQLATTAYVDAAVVAGSAVVADNSITNAKLRDSTALTVIGRSANSTGDPADIAAGSDGDVLRRSGTTLGFGAIPESSVTSLVSDLALKAPLASPTLTGTPLAPTPSASDNSTKIATTAYADNAVVKQPETLMFAVSDESTAITTGTAKLTFRMPFACSMTALPRANLNTVSSSGNPAINIKKNGTTIFSTTLTIDATELTSVTAATPAALTSSPTTFADDDAVTIDIDTAGTGAKGLKVTLNVVRT